MNFPSFEFDNVVAAVCHGGASEAQLVALSDLLKNDAAALDAYIVAVELHARLASDNTLFMSRSALLRVASPRRSFNRWAYSLGVVAALLVLALGVWRAIPPAPHIVQLDVLDAQDVTPHSWRSEISKSEDRLKIDTGTLRVRIAESGVALTILGPAELALVDAMRVRALKGQVIADVGERGKGFVIETSQGQFVDLGTTFGIDAGTGGATDLLVFKGSVQVFPDARRIAPLSTLSDGEAVRVSGDQMLTRLPNVVTGNRLGRWSAAPPNSDCVIAAVSDNLLSPDDKVCYQIIPSGLDENVQAYAGPKHIWKGRLSSGLPPYLIGADYVRTFVVDRRKKTLAITVHLSRPAVLYVLFECRPQQKLWRESNNKEEVPEWLRQNFKKTGDVVGLDDAGQLRPGETMSTHPGEGHLVTFDVWKRIVRAPGEVELGPPTGPDGWLNWMYGIAAKPLDQN